MAGTKHVSRLAGVLCCSDFSECAFECEAEGQVHSIYCTGYHKAGIPAFNVVLSDTFSTCSFSCLRFHYTQSISK